MKKKKKEFLKKCTSLLQAIDVNRTPERAAKFGHDIMWGLIEGDAEERYDAWLDWYENDTGASEQRNGAWVPAIPL